MERTGKEGAVRGDVHGDQCDLTTDILAPWLGRGHAYQDQETSAGQTIFEGQAELIEPERGAPSVSPSSLMDTCGPSISSLSSSYSSAHPYPNLASSSSSSSSSILSLTPPLPPSVELPSVLTDTRLTLDVYRGGAAALPLLWGAVPEQLLGVQYLRLGSEDKPGLNGALDVIPYLTDLRSLSIRGTFMINFMVKLLNNSNLFLLRTPQLTQIRL